MDRYRINTNAKTVVYKRRTGVQPQIFGFILGSAVYLVSGPERFLMKRDAQATERAFEMIFRLLLRPVGGGIESWAVFRRQRQWQGDVDEDDPGCILWHANWNHRTDLANEAWRGDLSNENWRAERFPTIQTTVRYASEEQASGLAPLFETLDRIVANGVALPESNRDDPPSWREYSLLRWLDWGIVDLTWNESRQNEQCEAAGIAIARHIENVMQDQELEHNEIAMLTMVFEWSPYFPDDVSLPIGTNR